MTKLIRIEELIKLMGFSRPTIAKLLKRVAFNGSSNVLYNEELRLYGVRDLETFYSEINKLNNVRSAVCLQNNKKKDYIKGGKSIGYSIPEEERRIASKLRQRLNLKP